MGFVSHDCSEKHRYFTIGIGVELVKGKMKMNENKSPFFLRPSSYFLLLAQSC